MYPDFIGIGAQKAGTSWLHALLSMHPQIWLPPAKEIHYFDHKFPVKLSNQDKTGSQAMNKRLVYSNNFKRRLGRAGIAGLYKKLVTTGVSRLVWDIKFNFGNRDDEWYASLFKPGQGKVTGDITPAYCRLDRQAIQYVARLMPDVKIVLLLRDPVDRAWSHALMDLGKHRNRPPSAIPDTEFLTHFNSTASRLRGGYMQIISNWSSVFSDDKIFVGFYDQISETPSTLLQQVLKFLEVSDGVEPFSNSWSKEVNKGEKIPIPDHLHLHLANIYKTELESLSKRFAGCAENWLERSSMPASRSQ